VSAGVSIFDGLGNIEPFERPVHLAIGMFDGVHLGHRAVIDAAVAAARADGGIAGILTFWPHPSRLFRPDDPERMIFDAAARRRELSFTEVTFIIEQPFDREFASIEAERFVAHLQQFIPCLETMYVGENWRYGRGRKGDVSMLVDSARAANLDVVSLERLQWNGEPISSTRIRGHLVRGEMEAVGELLGFPYFASGAVIPGQRLGRTIGFPTLNIAWEPDLRPALGVYAVRVGSAEGTPDHLGVANYGVRPTVDGAETPVLEVHVFASCPYHVGDQLQVEWMRFLRREKKFTSVGELRAQIGRDRDAAQKYFSESPATSR